MSIVMVDRISKSFGENQVVNDVSFTVEAGEIFGLLGPNGAGKTTSIRIVLDIFKPDSGKVTIFGSEMTEAKKEKIGYLPEERGLYQDVSLEHCLIYLATLKGLSRQIAGERIEDYLTRFDLVAHKKKKVKELSKGMQQKAQLITTLVHQPELIVIDEPFSALDPVNTQMVKMLLQEERKRGAAIIMCTHQMHQVEEMCDRIVLINQGQVMLYGTLQEIRRKHVGKDLLVSPLNALPEHIKGVEEIQKINGSYRLKVSDDMTSQEILEALVNAGVFLERFEIAMPTLDEIFIDVVRVLE